MIFSEHLSYESIGRMCGTSGNAVRKFARKLGIELTPRRKVNEWENFNRRSKSKVNSCSDDEFKNIILNNVGWKNIISQFGYVGNGSGNVHKQILERCEKLGINPTLHTPSPILSKTKGELLSDRKNYQSYRSTIRRMAAETYIKSGRPQRCVVCGYDKHIEIAHIKPVSDFDDSATMMEINSIDNLIALCPNHHWEFDNGFLKL